MNDYENNTTTSDDQRLEAWLAKAPMLPASPEFCSNVMRAINTKPRPWTARLHDLFFAPKTMRWNLAGAMASVFVMATVGTLTMQWRTASAPASAPLAMANNTVPETMPTTMSVSARPTLARFQLNMPAAREVAVVGDFSQWQQRYKLKRLPDGTWATDIPLPPGTYEYIFVVDQQQWMTDPRAKVYRDDGFGNKNAVVNVLSL